MALEMIVMRKSRVIGVEVKPEGVGILEDAEGPEVCD